MKPDLRRGDVLHYPGDRSDLGIVTVAPSGRFGEIAWLRGEDDESPFADTIDSDGFTDSLDTPLVSCGMRLSERHTAMIERRMERYAREWRR